MKYILPVVFVCWIFFVFSPSHIYATRSISIVSDKTTLFGNEEIILTASSSGFTEGETVYIKGAFYQNGSSNYFGFSKSGDEWIKNSASNISQRAIKIGEWDGKLNAKPDFTDSGYKGEGDYLIKLGYYFGSAASVNWSSNSLPVYVNEPDPTPTSTLIPTQIPTATHTPTNVPVVTFTPTPLPSLTLTPILTIKLSSTPVVIDIKVRDSITSDVPVVLGEMDEKYISSQSGEFVQKKILIISLAFIGSGLAVLTTAVAYRIVLQKKSESNPV